MNEYPERSKFFAHKAFRLMHKASVAAEIGRDAFCLVAVILHTEDAARYRGPVRFFNSQLMETLGFTRWETFNNARQKAISSGWLQYSGDGKRSAGLYFVTIPDGFDAITDDPIEPVQPDPLYTESGYKAGYDAGYKAGYDAGYKAGYDAEVMAYTKAAQSRSEGVYKPVEPYIPIPNPVPKYSIHDFVGPEIRIPKSLNESDIEAISDALNRYDIRLREIPESKPFRGNDVTIQSFWNTAARRGAAVFCESVEQAIRGGWLNLRFDGKPRAGERRPGDLTVDQEAEWVKITAACRMTGEKGDLARNALGGEVATIMAMLGGSSRIRELKSGEPQEIELKKRFFATREAHRKLQQEGVPA